MGVKVSADARRGVVVGNGRGNVAGSSRIFNCDGAFCSTHGTLRVARSGTSSAVEMAIWSSEAGVVMRWQIDCMGIGNRLAHGNQRFKRRICTGDRRDEVDARGMRLDSLADSEGCPRVMAGSAPSRMAAAISRETCMMVAPTAVSRGSAGMLKTS